MNMPKFKLFHFPASRSARVKWALHEVLDDNFEVEVVQLYEGRQYSPEYLARNPNHNVPTLEVTFADGSVMNMIESGAMVAWLVDAFPEKQLAPPSGALSAARADFLQMMHFGASWMDMMLWQIRIHEHVLPADQQDRGTVARYREKFVREVEPQLKARLDGAEHVCGRAFTAADCIIGHNVTWARGYGLCQDDVFRRYLSRVAKRPAFQKAFADARNFQQQVPESAQALGKFTG